MLEVSAVIGVMLDVSAVTGVVLEVSAVESDASTCFCSAFMLKRH